MSTSIHSKFSRQLPLLHTRASLGALDAFEALYSRITGKPQVVDCEVQELDAEVGWQEWQDSVIAEDEASAYAPTAHLPLQELPDAPQDFIDPFESVHKNSA